jgi:hypothetical protein
MVSAFVNPSDCGTGKPPNNGPEAWRLAESFLTLEGDTPFWTGKSELDHLTKNWQKIYTKVFDAAGIAGTRTSSDTLAQNGP